MSWIQSVLGMGNWEWCIWCYSNKTTFCTGKRSYRRTTLDSFHLAHRFLDERDACCGVTIKAEGKGKGKGKVCTDKYGWLVNDYHCDEDGDEFPLNPEAEYKVIRTNGKTKSIKGKCLTPGFTCPGDGCGKHFENEAAADADKKVNSTEYLRNHFGQKQWTVPIYKRIEQIDHIICFLHCLLRTTGKMFMTFVAERCDTSAKAKQVTLTLSNVMGISVPPLKSTTKGPMHQVKKVSFTGAESCSFIENAPLLLDVVYDRCPVTNARGKHTSGINIEVEKVGGTEEWVMGSVAEVHNSVDGQVQSVDVLCDDDGEELRRLPLDRMRGRQSRERELAEAAIFNLFIYINIVLQRDTPGTQKATDLRAQGEKVIQAMVEAGCAEDITPYMHSLVCAIPRQAEHYELMDLSGQALENLNQLMKRKVLTNKRYSTNKRTGAVPKKKMGKGMMQQMVDGFCALRAAQTKMKGTKRQRAQERTGGQRATKQLKQTTEAGLTELKTKHNITN